ncbi:hypothetical protein HR12_27495, partial [Microbacterium sp. SUBG005]
ARPGDTLAAIWQSVSGAYASFFQGAIYNFRRPEFATGIRPLTETLTFATPLIAAGLGVALAFRVGMFNIGGRGQMLVRRRRRIRGVRVRSAVGGCTPSSRSSPASSRVPCGPGSRVC